MSNLNVPDFIAMKITSVFLAHRLFLVMRMLSQRM